MQIKNLLKPLALALGITVLATACTSNTEKLNDFANLTTEQRVHALQGIKHLEEDGRIALIGRYKKQTFSVNCNYIFKNDSYTLEFTGPMGMRYVQLQVYANGTTFLNVQGENYKGDSARQLLKDEFNLDVPVEDLHSIMVGLPRGEKTYDAKGYVKTATYDDVYQVTYKSYKAFRKGIPLPDNMEILTPYTKILIKINNVNSLEQL